MDWLKILQEIFTVCIIPLIGILTKYLISYIEIKKESIKESNNSELAKKYVDLLAQTIETCVIATNQTYVEELKKQGHFDIEAQQLAFQKALLIVQKNLSSEARRYLTEFYGDLNAYIASSIEAAVNENK